MLGPCTFCRRLTWEFRRSVIVVAIEPSSSGSDGLHPQAVIILAADLSDDAVFPRARVPEDDDDRRLLEVFRLVLGGGLELMDPSDSCWMLEELLWILIDEFSEASSAEG